MNTTWNIIRWTTAAKLGEFTDVITEATWSLTASDEGNETKIFGTSKFPPPTDQSTYKAKGSITKDDLIEWIKPIMGYDAYLVNLQAKLTELATKEQTTEVPFK